MAKLTRVPAKVFAASAAATEIGQFGSAVAGSKLETADVATIQGLSAWLSGWSEALVSGNRYPALQEMNGAFKVLSYQGAYALQEGIPEYDSATTYYIGSIVKKTGTSELYKSIVNDNVGNVLTDDTKWLFLGDLSYLTKSIILVGTCSTASGTAEKAVICSDFELIVGATIQITFDNANTATTPTININSKGALSPKNMQGDALKYIPANIPLDFRYDGTNLIGLYTNTFAVMPDYLNPVSKAWNTIHQTVSDGYLYVYANISDGYNAYLEYSFNSDLSSPITVWVSWMNTLDRSMGASGFVPVPKGMYYKARGGGAGQILKFYSAKGAS